MVDASWVPWLLSLAGGAPFDVAERTLASVLQTAEGVREIVRELLAEGVLRASDDESQEALDGEAIRLHLAAFETDFESSEEAPENQERLIAEFEVAGGEAQPGPFVERTGPRVAFPTELPVSQAALPFSQALYRSEAPRNPVDFNAIAAILSHAARCVEVRSDRWGPYMLRGAASLGARHAVEVYVLAHRVGGLDPGHYAYLPKEHALCKVADVDRHDAAGPAARLVLSMRWPRYLWRYRSSANYFQWAHYDVGHMLSALNLSARCLGLTTEIVPTSTLKDDDTLSESYMVELALS